MEKKIFNRFFFLNLQGGLSNGWPDQILNELNTLDQYPAENRYCNFFLIQSVSKIEAIKNVNKKKIF